MFFFSFFLLSFEGCAGLLHMLAVHCCRSWRPLGAALLDVVQVINLINMRGLFLVASSRLLFETLSRCPVDGSVSSSPASRRVVERS